VEARRAGEAADERAGRAGCERHGWIGCGEERREGKATRTTTTTKESEERKILWLAGRLDFGAVWAPGSLQSTIIFQVDFLTFLLREFHMVCYYFKAKKLNS
jgi:hypothetical protein